MEKKIIPTANELFEQYHGFEADSSSRDIISLMIEFAKLHVEAALKNASERYEYDETHISDDPTFLKDSILNSYTLDKIK